jgi:membrane protein implicated in regulation of membrane protease activity
MRNNIRKYLLIALAVVIVGIFIYLMLLFTVWAIAFAVTVLTILVIILAISKTREWIRQKRKSSELRGDDVNREEIRTHRKY